MGEIKRYNDTIKEGMRNKDITVDELSEQTDIIYEYLNKIYQRFQKIFMKSCSNLNL